MGSSLCPEELLSDPSTSGAFPRLLLSTPESISEHRIILKALGRKKNALQEDEPMSG